MYLSMRLNFILRNFGAHLFRLRYAVMLLFVLSLSISSYAQNTGMINFVFTSDAHYGIRRANFRGDTAVTGHTVNTAMVDEMMRLPAAKLPDDDGVGSDKFVVAIDYVVQTGDIANRMEIPVQSAAASWAQFDTDYLQRLKLKDHSGKPTTVLLIPGNHDISNAIGHYKSMRPLTDPTSMVNIYNLMLKPATPMTNEKYNYRSDKINYSRDIGGIHFMFLTLWPDSAERTWMTSDLAAVSAQTPVIIFTHDQPECEAKHFTNPEAPGTFDAISKFENLAEERYKEGKTAAADGGQTAIEQRGLVAFLKKHPNIKAYFHGNSNFNEFYEYHGPDNDVSLNTFRVDSPMKGNVSSKDEAKLSFQLISLDTATGRLTVRECLWNSEPQKQDQPIVFGESKTIALK